ncbi:sensor histidine kinase [Desulfofustis glycolicus]|uniref:histidine kinase n=1 Tax=Desulfofustis glycolicus DSM 9705 TaxID=1121409 RepID=A0A1M5XAS3_9BACT|nr:PAS domain-containing sensor histidine kinase [Desulfofustis glycolicus]MCB2218174.1 hypothetical protein [Desulfobulbaceae bacterium]SHH96604.1 two-component system, NtrC family, sensor kinase [Desulfofustis glycolicus DSM 9705]
MERKRKYYVMIIRRLLLAFFCLSILPILSFAWLVKDSVEQMNIVKLEEQANNTIEHRAEVIALFLQDRLNLLTMIVELYPPEQLMAQETIEELFLAFGKNGDIVDLHVIDSSGYQHGYVGPYWSQIVGKTYNDASWFKETLINGVHISHVFLGYRNVPHFVIAVTDPLKTFVLRATINSSIFNSLLLSAQLGPNSDAFIVNRAGEFQTPSLLDQQSLSEQEKTLISSDTKAGPFHIGGYVYATRWIGNKHWLLVLKASIDDSLKFYYTIRDRILLIFSVIALLSLLLATFITVLLTRRIEKADREYAAATMQFSHIEKMATIGRLAAGIAHEINNPLQLITSQAGWIKELLPEEDPNTVKNLEEYQKAVEQIQYHVRRAGTITHRLLGFSRKMSAEKGSVRINDLLEETISFIEREADNNSIAVIKNFSEEMPPILTDGPQLQQVFLNLLNNALDAIGRRGMIEIATRLHADQRLVITFADNGPGMKPEQLKQIFDPFFTTKDPNKGTGLGLYISYDIIKKLGGEITGENREQGGMLFTIILPLTGSGAAGDNR